MASVLRDFLANLPQVHPEKRLRDVTKTKKTLKRKAFEDVSNQRKNGRSQAKSKSEKCIDAVSLKEKRSAHPKVTSKVVTSKSEESTVKRVKCGKVSSEKTVECPKKSRKSSKIPLPVQCKEEFGTSDLDLDGLSDAVDKLLSDVPSEVINIDEGNPNYFDCPTYARDIVAYMRSLEGVFQLPTDYLAEGSELKSSTRAILVDWLIQVQSHLYLQTETLHLAVAIVDQFIARVGIKMSKLQLLGITALLIAAKYEERFAPDIEKLIHLTDNTYTFNQVIKMEIVVLTTLKFELHMPTPTVFLNRFWKVLESTQGKVSFKVESMCSYLLDLGLTDLCLTRTSASVRAAAALYLANSITKTRNPESMGCEWSKELSYYTTHTLAEILPSVQKMAKLLLKAPVSKYQGARDKYSSKSMHGAISHWNALKDNSVIYKLAVEC